MKKIIFVAAVMAAAACVVAAWSQGGHPSRPEFGGQMRMGGLMMSCPAMAVMPPHAGMIDHMARTLHLAKEQTAKLNKIVADNDKKMHLLQQAAAKSSQALRVSLLASKYNAKKTKDLSIKAEKAEAALISASIDEWTRMRSVLTSKQSANLQKAMSYQRPRPGGTPPDSPGFPLPGSAPKGTR